MLGPIEKVFKSLFSSPNESSREGSRGSFRTSGLREVLSDDVVRVEAAASIISRSVVPSTDVSWEWESFPLAAARFLSNADLAEYLSAVDDLLLIVLQTNNSFTVGDSDLHDRVRSVLSTAMPRLKYEFGHLMMSNSTPFGADGSRLDSYIQRFTEISLTSGRSNNASIVSSSSSSSSYTSSSGGVPIVGLQACLHISSACISFPSSIASLSIGSVDSLDDITEARCVFNLEESVTSFLQDHDPNPILPEGISSLREIVDRMVRAGYHSELCELFVDLRRGILRSRLAVLGLEMINIEEAQRVKFTAVDKKVIRWILALKIVVSVVLYGEKRVCHQIFEDFDELIDERFAEVAMDFVMELLRMAKSIATLQRFPEKLFHILGLYETLLNVKPDLLALFSGTDKQTISREAEWVFTVLRNSVRSIFEELGNLIKKYRASARQLQCGEIHRLTRYLINYMRLLVRYSTSLNFLLHDDLLDDRERLPRNRTITPFGRYVILLISHLKVKLEEVSRDDEHPELQCLFMMNNMSYIVQKVKNSGLEGLMGDDWVQCRLGDIEWYMDRYLTDSWEKLLSYFNFDEGRRRKVSKVELKKRFKSFNLDFENICMIQAGWKVPDPQLREKLRMAVCDKVVPSYRLFLRRMAVHLVAIQKDAAKYSKFSPEDLQDRLSDLFEG
ncbi:exocyst complex component EXO70A1-like [Typha latifolia]|uniref:exocyst complex component EXO70A1-like n=1 Tax=Typha latifolia TaxID=4733 RepID=UPI003C2CD0AF